MTRSVRCMQRLIESMDNMTIDAFVYPGWGNPPRLIGDLQQSGNTPLGDPRWPIYFTGCTPGFYYMYSMNPVLYALRMDAAARQYPPR